MSILDINTITKNNQSFSKFIDLTEDLYIKGIKLQKLLWLDKYKNIINTIISDISCSHKTEIIELSYNLFTEGLSISNNENLDDRIAETEKNILKGTKYIFNATFYYNGILVVIDILKVDKKKVSIFKTSSHTAIDKIDVEAISLQYYVLKQLGYSIKNCDLIHINSDYVRGSHLEFDKLFSIIDITGEVFSLQRNVSKNLMLFKTTLKESLSKIYDKNIQDKTPNNSIFKLFKLGSQKQKQLYSKDILDISKIPDSFSLTNTQQKIVDVYKTNKIFVDYNKINTFVNTLTYPIYHLSISTYISEIPEFEDMCPYQKIPYKYSLDIESEDGSIKHIECFCDNLSDPRYEVAQQLCEDIPLDATILVYDKDIVEKIIRTLASPYNARTMHLMNIVKNLKDLMIPFQKNYYISPLQNLQYDLKSVSLALLPEINKDEKEKLLEDDCIFATIVSSKILQILKQSS